MAVKRIVVAGCRAFTDYDLAKEFIDKCISDMRRGNEIIIVSGGAKGADVLGERYAKENGFEIERHAAKREMAQIADLVICFWDEQSRGTRSMIEYARKYGKEVRIRKI